MAQAPLRILHLEDELSLCDIVKATLQILDPDCDLYQCHDADAALRYGRAHLDELHLLLLDVRVPGSTDGIGAARQIREAGYRHMVAFTSAFQPPQPSIIRELNCVWLPKPVDLGRMQTTLQAARNLVG